MVQACSQNTKTDKRDHSLSSFRALNTKLPASILLPFYYSIAFRSQSKLSLILFAQFCSKNHQCQTSMFRWHIQRSKQISFHVGWSTPILLDAKIRQYKCKLNNFPTKIKVKSKLKLCLLQKRKEIDLFNYKSDQCRECVFCYFPLTLMNYILLFAMLLYGIIQRAFFLFLLSCLYHNTSLASQ